MKYLGILVMFFAWQARAETLWWGISVSQQCVKAPQGYEREFTPEAMMSASEKNGLLCKRLENKKSNDVPYFIMVACWRGKITTAAEIEVKYVFTGTRDDCETILPLFKKK